MSFHNVSAFVKMWMEQQPCVKEESLTDWLLFSISQYFPSVYYKAFTRHEEAKNGADWEWWIITKSSYSYYYDAYRFFVQAKKLHANADNYPGLSYSNQNGMQIDLLKYHAKIFNGFPIYMFYSTSEPDISEQIKNISYIDRDALEWCRSCSNGCFLSNAHDIYKLLFSSSRLYLQDKDILQHTFKLSILDKLFNASSSTRNRILADFNNWVIQQDYEKSEFSNQNDRYYGIRHYGERIPSYLKLFIERQGEDLSWFESEMRRSLPDVGGIAVIDLRNS